MIERRVRLNARQREEIVLAWHTLSRAHREARGRVAAILNEHHITPETPGRLAVESDGALVFVVNERAIAQADGDDHAPSRE